MVEKQKDKLKEQKDEYKLEVEKRIENLERTVRLIDENSVLKIKLIKRNK